jgi:hypothetical protein
VGGLRLGDLDLAERVGRAAQLDDLKGAHAHTMPGARARSGDRYR